MRTGFVFLLILLSVSNAYTQGGSVKRISEKHFSVVPGSPDSKKYRAEISSDIDTTWDRWKERGYNFGFNPALTPMYSTISGIISTPYMIQVRGNADEKNKKRWGYHVFEGYARDDKSRITMLVNKHTELDKPVAELYYYGTEYNHSDKAYNWFRIGSDVRQHSFLFSRDEAVFYGSLKLNNVLTLGNISRNDIQPNKPAGDDEPNSENDRKYVNFKALKNSTDGSLFYDPDHKIVVIKIDGKWMQVMVQPLPDSIRYEFEK